MVDGRRFNRNARRAVSTASAVFFGLAVLSASAGDGAVPATAALQGAHAAPEPAAAPDPAHAESGRKLYVSYCARCHGLNLVNRGAAFDLRRFPLDNKARFVKSVSKGKRAMPAWGGTLEPDQIDFLWAYVASHPR